jgi:hypothetical protein
MVSLDMRLQPNDEEVIGKVLDGEAIVINLATGSYYAIPDVGGVIWQAVEERRSLEEIAVRVSASYEVSVEQARVDVLALAERLMQERIVMLAADAPADDAAPEPTRGPSPARRAPYAAPQLTAFSDMRNLLALDPPMPSLDTLAPGSGKGNRSGTKES